MHTILKTDQGEWSVGYWRPPIGMQDFTTSGGALYSWENLITFDNSRDAAAYCSYLNGGSGKRG